MKGKNLTDRVYKQIKKDIMLGRIPSNELFSEQMLSDKYNCSRTPAREAAGQLVAEGFLNKYPSKGYIVRLPTKKEMNEIRYCCYVLEKAALELSIHTAYGEDIQDMYALINRKSDDPEAKYFENMIFHCELAALSSNKTIVDLIEQLHSKMIRNDVAPQQNKYEFLGESRARNKEGSIKEEKPGDRNSDQHKAIIDALMDRNHELAQRILLLDIYPQAPVSEELSQEIPE